MREIRTSGLTRGREFTPSLLYWLSDDTGLSSDGHDRNEFRIIIFFCTGSTTWGLTGRVHGTECLVSRIRAGFPGYC